MSKLSSLCGSCGLILLDMADRSLTYSSLNKSVICREERKVEREKVGWEREERSGREVKGIGRVEEE